MNYEHITDFVKSLYADDPIPLHRPILGKIEKRYLGECIDSNFVSSVGARVDEFEKRLAVFAGVKRAVATVNGTAALHIALQASNVGPHTEVLTQPLTFAATVNAITYTGAIPSFIDVERATLGLDPDRLRSFLRSRVVRRNGEAIDTETGKVVGACVPVHIYGHPCRTREAVEVCAEYGIPVIEDAAEALGSYRETRHVGCDGVMATLSFNGNKVITTGGGGAILTDDDALADRLKYITTTAKRPHPYEFFHDEVGYNYRLPNLNAALGCAQMEQLPRFLREKRSIADSYRSFFDGSEIEFIDEPPACRSNFWLNGILFPERAERDAFLEYSNANGVMTRPFWRLMPDLPSFKDAPCGEISVARDLYDRGVALPSSVPLKKNSSTEI